MEGLGLTISSSPNPTEPPLCPKLDVEFRRKIDLQSQARQNVPRRS
jgi:hypothetical protein